MHNLRDCEFQTTYANLKHCVGIMRAAQKSGLTLGEFYHSVLSDSENQALTNLWVEAYELICVMGNFSDSDNYYDYLRERELNLSECLVDEA